MITLFGLLASTLFAIISIFFPIESFFLYLTLILIILLFLNPKFSLFLSVALLPLYNVGFEYGEARYPIYYIVIFLTFSLWVVRRTAKITEIEKLTSGLTVLLTIFGVFFVLWSAVTLFWSIDLSGGMSTFLELISGLLIFLMIPDSIKNKDDVRQFLGFLICVGFLLGIVTFISNWIDVTETKTLRIDGNWNFYIELTVEKGRAAGFTGVNYAAETLVFFSFIGLSFLFITEGKTKWIMAFVIFFLMITVIMTGSKSGFGGLIIGLFLLAFVFPFIKGRRISYLFITVIIIFFSYFIGTMLTTGDITKSRVTAVGASFSYQTRLDWWRKGFNALFETYGIGLGTGGIKEVLSPVQFAHNIFLSVLFDLGVIGLAIFTLLLIYLFLAFREAIRICFDKQIKSVVFCLIAAMVDFLTNNLLQGEYCMRLFWLILGVSLAVIRVACKFNLKTDNAGANFPNQ